jgi:hypothetical protein
MSLSARAGSGSSASGPHVHPSAPDTQTRLKASERLGRAAVTTTTAMSLIQPLVIPGHTADRTMTAASTDPPRPTDRTAPAHLLHQAHLTVRRRAGPRPNPSPVRRRVALVQDTRTQAVTPVTTHGAVLRWTSTGAHNSITLEPRGGIPRITPQPSLQFRDPCVRSLSLRAQAHQRRQLLIRGRERLGRGHNPDDRRPQIEPDTPSSITHHHSRSTHRRRPSSTGPVNGHL